MSPQASAIVNLSEEQARPHLGRRGGVIVVAMCLAWVVLAVRLIHVQGVERSYFAARANRQRTVTDVIPARPGEIVDRHGRLLATTVTSQSLFLVPNRIDDPAEVAAVLGPALGLEAKSIEATIDTHRDKHFCWLKRRLSDEEVAAVRGLQLESGCWGFREEYLRRYPQGALAAHVLGIRDIDGTGRGGLEQQYDELLHGRDGRRILVRDARGRVIEVQADAAEEPRHGQTLVLSLDTVVQLHAERELDRLMSQRQPRSACAVVMDPKTGELLASASRPTFDPNRPEPAGDNAWKNTVVAAIYEPGSTFKPFVLAWALEQGVLRPDESLDCERGAYRMGRRVLHDHHAYGSLSVTDVLVKSSNIGMAKIGERLTNSELYQAAVAFGFGNPTGCDLPGELPGLLRPLDKWTGYSTGSIPMGQELAVTPLQLITAHAALANGGKLLRPIVVLKQVDFAESLFSSLGADRESTVVTSRTVRPEVARWLVSGPMTEVVRRGTGTAARLEGYRVFGKTGTAQKPDPETGETSRSLHVSSFVCGAPADDPRVLVLVLVDEPTLGANHNGGSVAAPAAAEILKKTLVHLRVPPERPVQTARAPED